MTQATGKGLDLGGVLAYLAGQTNSTGNDYGEALCANLAWGTINGHGAKTATLTPAGAPLLDTVGALNAKAGTVGYEINLVANVLAGTVGYEAALALRVYGGLT